MSLLRCRKSTSSLSYLGFELASICTVLVGSLASIRMALASSAAMKAPDVGGMAELSSAKGTRGMSSLNLATTTAVAASSMMSCSQYNTYCVLASTMITPMGSGILSLR
jgi:hypothetical protein